MKTANHIYERYNRQLILKEFGEAAQLKLLDAKVLVVGAGGLGCACLQYLAAAGTGTIGIIDDDIVTLSNLHRQVLYTVRDIGLSKAVCAASILGQLNPDIVINSYNERLIVSNAIAIFGQYDIIIDGTDNFSSRYMINDAAVLSGKPVVYGAVSKFEGQVAVFNYTASNEITPVNYRDLFPEPPAAGEINNCAEAGVLGVLPGIIGTLQASETIKLITGIGTALVNKLVTFNALNNQWYELALTARETTRGLIPADAAAFQKTDYDWLCGVVKSEREIDTATFNQWKNDPAVLVIDVREWNEQPVIDEFTHLHIPLGQLNQSVAEIEADTIVFFCQTGMRSAQAAEIMTGLSGNRKKIFSLSGGILNWKKEQLV